MDRATLSQRIESILNEITRLSNTLYAIMGLKEANIPIYAAVKSSVNLCPFPGYQTC